MQTNPIDDDPDFRALEAHADSRLRPKGYKLLPRKGSTSWIDPRIKPADAAVRFKLCYYPTGIFFGARQEWANSLGVPLASVGAVSETVSPSPVVFRGDFVTNTPAGKSRIDAIIGLFP